MTDDAKAGKLGRLWLALAFIIVSLAALVIVYFGGSYFAECSNISNASASARTATGFVNSLIEANDRSTTVINVSDDGSGLDLITYETESDKPTFTHVYLEDGVLCESISDPNSQGYPDAPAQVEKIVSCDSFNVTIRDNVITVTCGDVSSGWSPRAASLKGERA